MPAPSWVEFMDLDYLSTVCDYECHSPLITLFYFWCTWLPLLPSELLESCFPFGFIFSGDSTVPGI